MRDQAEGLRRLFGAEPPRHEPTLVPVVAPTEALAGGDFLLDQLVGAYLERGLKVLVVDAGPRAQPAPDLARVDLAACVQRLSADVRWLDAKGLVAHHLDARGQATALRERLAEAVPDADVVLLHAPVAELARVLPGALGCRPVLLADLAPASITAAYAAMKWLNQRAGVAVFSLLVGAHPKVALTQRVMRQLADTAERFLGVAVADTVAIEPQVGLRSAVAPGLRRMARDSLRPLAAGREASGIPAQNGGLSAGAGAALHA
jgi:flagellar biosynthesis protein FlhG